MRLIFAFTLMLFAAHSAEAGCCGSAQTTVDVTAPAPYTAYTTGKHPVGTIFDARGEDFFQDNSANADPAANCNTGAEVVNPNPVRNAGTLPATPQGKWHGGHVLGNHDMTVDTFLWGGGVVATDTPSNYCNSAAVLMDMGGTNGFATSQRISNVEVGGIDATHGVWDGLKFNSSPCLYVVGSCHNYIEHVYVWNVTDDAIENDSDGGLTVSDSLFDGVYTLISARPSGVPPAHLDHSAGIPMTFNQVFVRIAPRVDHGDDEGGPGITYVPCAADGCSLGVFKIEAESPAIIMNNSIVAFHEVNRDLLTHEATTWAGGWDKVSSCSNNYLLWMSEAAYPTASMGTVPGCFTVVRDDNAVGTPATDQWNAAVADWHARHPNVGD